MIIVNGKELNVERFPNGESMIREIDNEVYYMNRIVVTLKYEDDRDLINLMLVKKHIDETIIGNFIATKLNLTYMPYSRMDRVENTYQVFTLKHIAEFINNLNFDVVEILEPHSDVTPALIKHAVVNNKSIKIAERVWNELDFEEGEDYLVFPDATADKRYNKGWWKTTLTCNKHRDFDTGKILSLEVNGNIPTKPFRAIIVDDLCSRGGTFMLTAQKLKEMGATEIHLVVAHCEDSIHDGDILKTDLIERVHTTNSILTNTKHEKLEVSDVVNV